MPANTPPTRHLVQRTAGLVTTVRTGVQIVPEALQALARTSANSKERGRVKERYNDRE